MTVQISFRHARYAQVSKAEAGMVVSRNLTNSSQVGHSLILPAGMFPGPLHDFIKILFTLTQMTTRILREFLCLLKAM